jgi:hypothetical protein
MHAIQLRGGRGRYSAGTTGSFSRPDRRKLSRRDSNFLTSTRAPRFSKFFVYCYKDRKLAGGDKTQYENHRVFRIVARQIYPIHRSEKTFPRIHRTNAAE